MSLHLPTPDVTLIFQKKMCGPALHPLPALPHRLAVLVFIENPRGELLLLLRTRPPNLGVWSPPGGKLETALGESPFECAARETLEETGLAAAPADFHLFALISEQAYEGEAHWMLFLFRLKTTIAELPPAIAEGRFGFFSRAAVDSLAIPATDRAALWPIYDQHRNDFVALRLDCAPGRPLRLVMEQVTAGGSPPPPTANNT